MLLQVAKKNQLKQFMLVSVTWSLSYHEWQTLTLI